MKIFHLVCLALFGTLSAFASEGVQDVHEQNFDSEVKSGIVLVDFYGSWCGPCKQLSPILDKVSQDLKGAKIVKVNIDKSKSIASRYDVNAVPTMILLKNGKEVGRLVGFNNKAAIENFIDSAR